MNYVNIIVNFCGLEIVSYFESDSLADSISWRRSAFSCLVEDMYLPAISGGFPPFLQHYLFCIDALELIPY